MKLKFNMGYVMLEHLWRLRAQEEPRNLPMGEAIFLIEGSLKEIEKVEFITFESIMPLAKKL